MSQWCRRKSTQSGASSSYFIYFSQGESNVRFSSFVLAPSIWASTMNSPLAFVIEPLEGSCSRACRMVPASVFGEHFPPVRPRSGWVLSWSLAHVTAKIEAHSWYMHQVEGRLILRTRRRLECQSRLSWSFLGASRLPSIPAGRSHPTSGLSVNPGICDPFPSLVTRVRAQPRKPRGNNEGGPLAAC